MILGLFMDKLGIPVVPAVIIILSIVVLIAGFAFMIFRHIYEKGESDIDPALYKKIQVIAAWVFVIYALIEFLAAGACITVNEACRNGYHYDIVKGVCRFCTGFKDGASHSAASDCLTLGVYFDAFILNSFITNTIHVIGEKLDSKRKKD
ncbi:MAG: hypothetical protein K5876_03675 [Ruminiclostridium sp.]|nr:hypothetical protein [Ruminiclostridium sp.]